MREQILDDPTPPGTPVHQQIAGITKDMYGDFASQGVSVHLAVWVVIAVLSAVAFVGVWWRLNFPRTMPSEEPGPPAPPTSEL